MDMETLIAEMELQRSAVVNALGRRLINAKMEQQALQSEVARLREEVEKLKKAQADAIATE